MIALLGRVGRRSSAGRRCARPRDERARAPRRSPALALLAVFAVATTVGPFSDITVNDLYVYEQYAILLHDGQLPYVDFGFEYPPLAALPLWLAGRVRPRPGVDRVDLRRAHGALPRRRPAARRAPGRRRPRRADGGLAARADAGADRRVACARTSTRCRSRSRWPACSRSRASATTSASCCSASGTMTKLFPGLLAVVALVWLARARRVARRAARRRDLRRGRRRDLAAARRARATSTRFEFHLDRPGADRVDAGERAVRARRLGRHRHEPAPGPLQVKRPRRRSRRRRRGAVRARCSCSRWRRSCCSPRAGPSARHMVLCGFAALLAFVTLGKVFSPQYVIWLAPFAALAWVWGQRAVALLVGRGDRAHARRVPEPLLRPHQRRDGRRA